eukprot:3218682-Rhodomonas_salina.1
MRQPDARGREEPWSFHTGAASGFLFGGCARIQGSSAGVFGGYADNATRHVCAHNADVFGNVWRRR